MGLDNALGEDTGILGVEEQVDAGELNVLLGSVPISGELLRGRVVVADEDWAPVTTAVFVLTETLSWNGSEGAIELGSVADPLFGESTVVLSVVEGLEGEPVGGGDLRISVVDSLYFKNQSVSHFLMNYRY